MEEGRKTELRTVLNLCEQ